MGKNGQLRPIKMANCGRTAGHANFVLCYTPTNLMIALHLSYILTLLREKYHLWQKWPLMAVLAILKKTVGPIGTNFSVLNSGDQYALFDTQQSYAIP